MKTKLFIFVFFNLSLLIKADEIDKNYLNKIVKSIYLIEGGQNSKFPFGIKSIETKENYKKAKRICENTVRNNWIRFNKLNKIEKEKYHCYLDFLASHYCPKSYDLIGHQNWIKNIHHFIGDKKK